MCSQCAVSCLRFSESDQLAISSCKYVCSLEAYKTPMKVTKSCTESTPRQLCCSKPHDLAGIHVLVFVLQVSHLHSNTSCLPTAERSTRTQDAADFGGSVRSAMEIDMHFACMIRVADREY